MKLPDEPDFEMCPEGTHVATCYQVIDFGSRDFQGDKKFKRKVWIGWELTDELMADGRPFAVGHEYTLSSYEEAPLRKHLEAWRGQKFKEEDFGPEGSFSIENLLGAACLISVKLNDRNKAKVTAVVAPPKGMPKRVESANPPIYLSLEPSEFDVKAFDAIPEWMQKVVRESPEWGALENPEAVVGAAPESSDPYEAPEEEIPF